MEKVQRNLSRNCWLCAASLIYRVCAIFQLNLIVDSHFHALFRRHSA